MNKLEYFRRKGKLVHLEMDEDEIWRKMFRAGLETICPVCGKMYIDHPYIDNVIDRSAHGEETPFLHLICDGSIVKL